MHDESIGTVNIILTGATGFVGEGVLLECLRHPAVSRVLMVNRRHSARTHPKLEELIVPDFLHPGDAINSLQGYDACFYCAGISSVGLSEEEYSRVTYDTAIHFARELSRISPGMAFCHISGLHTDTSGRGKIMWARVKGRTENDLLQCPFRAVYNFRPGFMKPTEGQRTVKAYYKLIGFLYPTLRLLMPGQVSTMREVGLAMINSALFGYPKSILEVADIKLLAHK
jgi:uncharacterized protein YbjT (DUF2867 family)